MSEPRWITKRALVLLHAESLAEHGGAVGLRDEELLESALAHARNLYSYGVVEVGRLAAAYGAGVAQNRPFNDGNKRAAFLAIGVFLARNGYRFYAGKVDSIVKMIGLAAGEIGEEELAAWVREYMERESMEGESLERKSLEPEPVEDKSSERASLKLELAKLELPKRESAERETTDCEPIKHKLMDRTGT